MKRLIITTVLTLAAYGSFAQLWYRGRYKEYEDGMNGIYLVQPVTYSPDGKNCYIGSYNGFTWYDVDVVHANLTYKGTLTDGSLAGGDGISDGHAICMSPDGRFVYLAAGYMENSISIFTRNTTTGEPTFLSIIRDGDMGISNLKYPYGMVMDRMGKNLYAACKESDGNSLIWFSVNSSTGALTYQGKFVDNTSGIDGLEGADNVTISGDGKNIYVTAFGDDALTWYTRDTTTGNLTYGGMLKDNTGGVDGLDNPYWVTVSPDGKYIYVGGQDDNSVAWFSRSAVDGSPTYVNRVSDGAILSGARGICLHPSGDWLVASASWGHTVSWYSVNKTTGALTMAGYVKNGEGGVDGIRGTRYNGFSPDGSLFIATGYDDNGVAWFNWGPYSAGVSAVAGSGDITIYPNPARHTLYCKGKPVDGSSLILADVCGRVVYSAPLADKMSLPGTLTGGAYYYTITDKESRTLTTGMLELDQ